MTIEATALLIIDMQEAYFAAGELQEEKAQLVENCNELISVGRQAERPVIFIRTAHTHTPDTWTLNMRDDEQGYLLDGSDEVQFVEGLDVHKADVCITKLRDSAFHATILEQTLRELHVDTLVIAGVSTQSCIGQTAADAYARNIRVVLAEEAIGTHDHTFHEPTLKILSQEYRQIRASIDDIRKWFGAG
jgi:nicotinamidase-related amidase